MLLLTAVDWSLIDDRAEYSLVKPSLPDGPSQDANIPLATDGLIEQRRAAYRRARERAAVAGFAEYESDGKSGSELPAGHYELWGYGGDDVRYRKVEPAPVPKAKPKLPGPRKWNEDSVPIPWPDPSMVDPLIVFPRGDGATLRDIRANPRGESLTTGTSECVGQT